MQRHPSPTKITRFLSFFLMMTFGTVSITPLLANDGVFYSMGNTLVPVKETTVELRKEVLTLERRPDGMHVTVEFTFYNPGPEKAVTVGFVTPPAYGDVGDAEAEHPQIRDFTARVNGEVLNFDIHRLEESGFQRPGLEVDGGSDFVYHFPVRFPKGESHILHTYVFQGGSSVEEAYYFPYRLTTGTMWANEEIGDFTLRIKMGRDEFFMAQSGFWKDSTRTVDWKGEGSCWVHPPMDLNLGWKLRRTPVFQRDGWLTFHAQHFKPEMDLSLEKYQLHNEVRMWREDQQQHPFTDLIACLPPWGTNPDDFRERTDQELRWLRNFIFAWHGYQFNSRDLQELFGQYIWYHPDPTIEADAIVLSDQEKEILALILAEEARRR